MDRLMPKELVDKHTSMIPLQRYGSIDDIAWTALFLFSPAASYVTGTVSIVDGGDVRLFAPLSLPSLYVTVLQKESDSLPLCSGTCRARSAAHPTQTPSLELAKRRPASSNRSGRRGLPEHEQEVTLLVAVRRTKLDWACRTTVFVAKVNVVEVWRLRAFGLLCSDVSFMHTTQSHA